MSTGQDRTKSIVVFASGEGTLFAAIASPDAQAHHGYAVSALVTNRMSCGAAKMARELGVAVVSSSEFEVDLGLQPQLVVLAGYLRLIPDVLIQAVP
jgi:folate-dependent phosphoribosylglycinamide formyltransferase PurN